MCSICRQNPCDHRCPNAETQKFFCANCEELITENDELYTDGRNEFCGLECVMDYYNIEKE